MALAGKSLIMEVYAKCINKNLQGYAYTLKYVLIVETETSFLSNPKIRICRGAGVYKGLNKITYNSIEDFLKDWTEIVTTKRK